MSRSSHNCQRSTPMTNSWQSARSLGVNSSSFAANNTEAYAPSATRRRISNADIRAGETELDFAKTVANFQMCAVEKISDAHATLRFRLHFKQTQRSRVAALHQQIVAMRKDNFTRLRVQRRSLGSR